MLPQKNRLKLNSDFSKLFKTGHSNYGRFIGVKIKENNEELNKYAVVVSNKINKSAVRRNYIKRKIKEKIREIDKSCKKGFNCVIIVLSDIKEDDYLEVKKEIIKIFTKLKIIN